MLKSRPDQYGAVVVSLHWLSAILILGLLCSGFVAANTSHAAFKAVLLRGHIPIAVIALVLTVIRVVWWWRFDTKPRTLEGMPVWQAGVARAVHVLLYVVVLVMFASGAGMIILSKAGPAIFEANGAVPNFADYPPHLPHALGGLLFVALLAFHTCAALRHHFILRDGLLRRMWYA